MFSLKTFRKPVYSLELADGTKQEFDPIQLMTDIDTALEKVAASIYDAAGQTAVREVLKLLPETEASAVVALYSDLKTFITNLDFVKNISAPPLG